MIVDDAAIETASLARMLVGLGHEVVATAADAEAAFDLAVSEAPDLAIVDGRVPPNGGVAVLEGILARTPAVRVAVIASLSEIELVRAAVAAGACAAFRRPLLRSQVASVLGELTGFGARPS